MTSQVMAWPGLHAQHGPTMRHIVPVCLLLLALVHALPLSGVLGGPQLTALYGVPVRDPDLALLLRHRAVLFGLVAAVLAAAAFLPALRTTALWLGAASVLSFVLLAALGGPVNASLRRVVLVDLALLPVLALAAWQHLRSAGLERG